MNTAEVFFRKHAGALLLVTSVLLTVGVGVADYLAGTDLSFSVFYLIPICLAAWFVGRGAGIFVSVCATIAWIIADLMGAVMYENPMAAFWNGPVRLGVFLVVAFLLSEVKQFQKHLEEMVKKRTAALTAEVAERRRAEQEKMASEERFRQLAENIREVFWLTEAQTNQIIYVSPAYEEIWGRSCQSLNQEPNQFLDAVHRADREHVSTALQGKMLEPVDAEFRIMRPDGSTRWVHARAFPIRNHKGEVYRIAGFAQDISEAKRLELQLLTIRQTEQHRIGQDLHDGLGQLLTGAELRAKVLEQRLTEKSLPEADDAKAIATIVNQALAQTRELARELYPVHEEANGLVSALEQLAVNQQQLCGIPCKFESQDSVLIYDNNAATQLYRIAQEAMNNAVKHGKPKRIEMRLTTEGDSVRLTVQDDGLGFPEQLDHHHGSGLRIMNYRAKVIGASLDIRRGAACGTVVTCAVNPSALES